MTILDEEDAWWKTPPPDASQHEFSQFVQLMKTRLQNVNFIEELVIKHGPPSVVDKISLWWRIPAVICNRSIDDTSDTNDMLWWHQKYLQLTWHFIQTMSEDSIHLEFAVESMHKIKRLNLTSEACKLWLADIFQDVDKCDKFLRILTQLLEEHHFMWLMEIMSQLAQHKVAVVGDQQETSQEALKAHVLSRLILPSLLQEFIVSFSALSARKLNIDQVRIVISLCQHTHLHVMCTRFMERWIHPIHVHQYTDIHAHQIISSSLVLCMRKWQSLNQQCPEKWRTMFARGVSGYASQYTNARIRWWGLKTAEALAPIFYKDASKLNFELETDSEQDLSLWKALETPITVVHLSSLQHLQLALETQTVLKEDVIIVPIHTDQTSQEPPKDAPSKLQQIYGLYADSDDDSDCEEIPAFNTMNTTQKVESANTGSRHIKPPRYLLDCLQYLTARPKTANTDKIHGDITAEEVADKIKVGLEDTARIIDLHNRSNQIFGRQHFDELAPQLVPAVLGLSNEYEFPNFDRQRFNILKSCFKISPGLVGGMFVDSFWNNGEMSIVRRVGLLELLQHSVIDTVSYSPASEVPKVDEKKNALEGFKGMSISQTRYFHPESHRLALLRSSTSQSWVNPLQVHFLHLFMKLACGIDNSNLAWVGELPSLPHLTLKSSKNLTTPLQKMNWEMKLPQHSSEFTSSRRYLGDTSAVVFSKWMETLCRVLMSAGPAIHAQSQITKECTEVLGLIFEWIWSMRDKFVFEDRSMQFKDHTAIRSAMLLMLWTPFVLMDQAKSSVYTSDLVTSLWPLVGCDCVSEVAVFLSNVSQFDHSQHNRHMAECVLSNLVAVDVTYEE